MLYGFLLFILLISAASLVAIPILQSIFGLGGGPSDSYTVLVVGDNEVNVTLSEMQQMDVISRDGAYQNRLGNIGGNGTYRGVRVSDLLDLVGGMSEDDNITVIAIDGYNWTFPYYKVNPNQTYYDIQGDMVIAFGLDGSVVPNYSEGFRLMFLPEDGLYSNADANATSDPNPPGAGPQCVSNVVRIVLNRPGPSAQNEGDTDQFVMLSEQAFSSFIFRSARRESFS